MWFLDSRRKTIYEYHRVDFTKEDIKNWTVIHIIPLPTCMDSTDCVTCLTRKISFQVCNTKRINANKIKMSHSFSVCGAHRWVNVLPASTAIDKTG